MQGCGGGSLVDPAMKEDQLLATLLSCPSGRWGTGMDTIPLPSPHPDAVST